MLAPRWRKVLRDVLRNPTRTLLVVVSIAVGVIAVGMVTGGYAVIATDLPASYLATKPAHGRLVTGPFDDELVSTIRRMAEVEEAAGERRITVQAGISGDRWQELQLVVLEDFDDQRVNQVLQEAGQWPPDEMELLVERASLSVLEGALGEPLLIKLANDDIRELTVVGLAHDLNEIAAGFTGVAYGYITFDTLEKLGYPRTYNQIVFRSAEQSDDRAHNELVAQAVSDKVEKAGIAVLRSVVPRPGEHQMQQFLTPMLLILGAMGMLSLLLSGFLVVNIITALLAQQTRQIGVMKTVGAGANQIAAMYLAMVLLFALLALLLAVPLGSLAAQGLTNFAAGLMNFDVVSSGVPGWVLALEIGVGAAVPLLAALLPVLRGTRVTVRVAISDYGVAAGAGEGRIDRAMDRAIERLRGLSRPTLISLRNTFRRKGRLLLTLTTLTLASAIFISVFSVRSSLHRTMDDSFAYWNYEVTVNFGRSYRADHLARVALDFPGVVAAEAWGFRDTTRLRPDDTESDNILLIAPQPETTLLQPTLLEGRWLLPADESAVVINTDLLDDEPDLRVGDTMTLEIDGRESDWTVVGIVRSVLAGPFAYANYPWFAQAVRSVGQANTLNIGLADKSRAAQIAAGPALEEYLRDLGFSVNQVETTVQRQERVASQFGVLIVFLAIMAVMLAVVGGLGLMGTMSINVLERRREIGVMRSIGASSGAIMQIVIVEGVLIGALSWTIGALLAIPLSKVLSDAVGTGFINSQLTYSYSLGGAGTWLAVMAGLSALASYLPARSAARLTVREVLAYE